MVPRVSRSAVMLTVSKQTVYRYRSQQKLGDKTNQSIIDNTLITHPDNIHNQTKFPLKSILNPPVS